MKNEFLPVHRFKAAAQGLLLGSCLLLAASAGAQNLLKNGDFETPQATTNAVAYWTPGFLWGGPDDFEILDRTTVVQSGLGGYANFWSLGIRPATERWCHAYFSQTVSNLVAGHAYNVSGYMLQERYTSVSESFHDQYLVYIEAIGGQGTSTPDGRAYVFALTTTQTDNIFGPPTWFCPANNQNAWLQFTNTQTPAANGTIEIRLHLSKISFCLSDKISQMTGFFDNISLTP